MPASASWALIASASWLLIGIWPVVSVNVNPFGLPPSASYSFALARSRLIGGIELSYAQEDGEIGPFAATPTPSQTPFVIASLSSPCATASRSALLSNGGRCG